MPTVKTARTLNITSVMSKGWFLMRHPMPDGDGLIGGFDAYNCWIDELLALDGGDDKALDEFYRYHRAVLFSLAELRSYTGGFLSDSGFKNLGANFAKIHDICWQIDAVCGKEGAAALRSAQNRERIAELLRQISALDDTCATQMEAYTI